MVLAYEHGLQVLEEIYELSKQEKKRSALLNEINRLAED